MDQFCIFVLMGVELYIVRRTDYDNYEEDSNITLDEWKAMVDADAELTWKQYEHSSEDTDYKYCYWLKHPDQDHSNRPWFHYSHGSISTKWIYSPCFEKLNEMTTRLGGRLESIDGPLSDVDIEHLKQSETVAVSAVNKTPEAKKKPFWKFW